MTKCLFSCLCAFFVLSASFAQSVKAESKHEYDVVIYGGTSAAVTAAIQVSKMGKTVVIVSPDKHLGGLTSGGLGWTDSGRKDAIGGLSKTFYQRIHQYYSQEKDSITGKTIWKYEKPSELNKERGRGIYNPKATALWVFEPHVAELIYDRMIKENNIPVFRDEWLDRKSGVTMKQGSIHSIRTLSGKTFTGKMFLDTTYEGDLLAAAGVSYHVGREANSQYDETINGIQTAHKIKGHLFIENVDPFVVKGDPKSGTLYGVHNNDPGTDFEGDHRIQAYCFRMCMTDEPEIRVPFPKPVGYDEKMFELLLRNFEAGDMRIPFKPDMMPNRKTDTNNKYAVSTDNIGMNYDYPEADYETRKKIIAQHELYQKGLMWTLANHPRVPESIRKEVSKWGLAKDEFTDNGNWPHQLYVREARRMKSDYVTTENDCRRIRIANDSVGMGSYNMDSHNCQRYVDKNGFAKNEGDIQISPGGAYVIGYKTLVPKKGEAKNLLVPVCVSSTHIAFGSIRMEPVFMILGQSAATAACIAIDDKVDVQNVEYAKLRKRLLADGQALDLPPNSKPKLKRAVRNFPGIVIDDEKAILEGDWTRSSAATNFIEEGYKHNGNYGNKKTIAIFESDLKPGRYEVRFAYTANNNRASNVPVTVHHANGHKTILINEKKTPKIDETFEPLGIFEFKKNQKAKVVISTESTDGYVVVDAVQFLPVK